MLRLEQMLTQAIKEGNDDKAKEIEKRILQKERKKGNAQLKRTSQVYYPKIR